MARAPIYPDQCYRDGWLGWAYLFGTGPAKPRRKYAHPRTLEQWVEFAEGLAAQNGGMLPNARWLEKNHGSLYNVMREHREAFAHIPQGRLKEPAKTLAQWVEFAEQLASQHGGILPNPRLLRRNYSGLDRAMHRNRAAFAHIPQARLHEPDKTLAQWVQFAEDLATRNGGMLPHATLLQKTHKSLSDVRYKNRAAFAHIPQRKFDRWGNEITKQPFPKEQCHV